MFYKMKHVLFLLSITLLFALPASGTTAPATRGFATKAFHVTFRPQIRSITWYRNLIDQLADRGYTLVIFNLGGMADSAYTITQPGELQFKSCSTDQVRSLVDYTRKKGLDFAFEVKVIGKLRSVLSKFSKAYPQLLVAQAGRSHGIVNMNYRFPDGVDAYDKLILPMLDNLIDLYGKQPPKYMLLGNDEILVKDLAKLGKAMGIGADQYMATCLNRCVEHLLARGITPILWGDMFLSTELAGPDSGVKGFAGDPRFALGGTFHAQYLNEPTLSVVKAMNDLRHRDRIIMAHWQYWPRPNGAFPAVDYFQKMGFKDVWGSTWFSEETIRQFSRYAAKRHCGGMIATSWHTSFSRRVAHLFQPLIDNSVVYFRNPDFLPPADNESILLDQAPLPWTLAPGQSQRFTTQLPDNVIPLKATVWLQKVGDKKHLGDFPLTYHTADKTLTGTLTLPPKYPPLELLTLGLSYRDRNSGYRMQRVLTNAVAVTHQTPARAGKPLDWLNIDFTELSKDQLRSPLLSVGGPYGGWLQKLSPSTDQTASFITPPLSLWKRMRDEGFRVTLECRITKPFPHDDPLLKPNDSHAALLSFGSWNQGFRLLLEPNSGLLLQLGRTQPSGSPTALTMPACLRLNQWAKIEFELLGPDKQGNRYVSLRVDEGTPLRVLLPQAPNISTAALGLGCEFRPNTIMKRSWPDFPGQIRRVTISPIASSQTLKPNHP